MTANAADSEDGHTGGLETGKALRANESGGAGMLRGDQIGHDGSSFM
jgi:hypothetical protein